MSGAELFEAWVKVGEIVLPGVCLWLYLWAKAYRESRSAERVKSDAVVEPGNAVAGAIGAAFVDRGVSASILGMAHDIAAILELLRKRQAHDDAVSLVQAVLSAELKGHDGGPRPAA